MAFDNLEERLLNQFNKYKNILMSGKDFFNAAIGVHEDCPADKLNIKVTEDGKYEVSIKDNKEVLKYAELSGRFDDVITIDLRVKLKYNL